MNNQAVSIQVLMLKTDSHPKPIPFLCSPSGWAGTSPVILPAVESAVSDFFIAKGTNKEVVTEKTLVVHLRRDFSAREIRTFIAQYHKMNMQFLLFICDCIERSDMVMNTIIKIYGKENISLPEGINTERGNSEQKNKKV